MYYDCITCFPFYSFKVFDSEITEEEPPISPLLSWEEYAQILPAIGSLPDGLMDIDESTNNVPLEETDEEPDQYVLNCRSLFTIPENIEMREEIVSTSQIAYMSKGEEYAYLSPIIESLHLELTGEEGAEAIKLLQQYSHVFSSSEFDLGHTSVITHHIDTGNAKSF